MVYNSENCIGTPFTSGRAGMGREVRRSVGLRVGRAAGRVLATVFAWRERARQRRDLMALDARELRDIGLSRADAEAEGSKPFWRR